MSSTSVSNLQNLKSEHPQHNSDSFNAPIKFHFHFYLKKIIRKNKFLENVFLTLKIKLNRIEQNRIELNIELNKLNIESDKTEQDRIVLN